MFEVATILSVLIGIANVAFAGFKREIRWLCLAGPFSCMKAYMYGLEANSEHWDIIGAGMQEISDLSAQWEAMKDR